MADPLGSSIRADRDALLNTARTLNAIYQQVVAPALARNYAQSGIRTRRGLLMNALMSPGAKGNICRVEGNTLTFGVSYEALPYAKYVIEGRGPVRARKAKALRFFDAYGKPVFRKSVGPAPAHDIIYLTEADMAKANEIAMQMLGEGKQFVRTA